MPEHKAPEPPIATIDGVKLHGGGSYLIKDRTSARLYSVYNALVEHMDAGLCISRTFQNKVAAQHSVRKGQFVWMTTNTVGYDRCVNPTNISMLHMAIIDFLKSTPRGVISVDGLEYLISNNGFEAILRLLHSINDKVTVSHSVLLVTIDEHTVEPRELRILEKDFEATL